MHRLLLRAPARRCLSSAAPRPEHAVISAFDLFSIGVGPSSSHTVGPMRAGRIFINDLKDLGLLEKQGQDQPVSVLRVPGRNLVFIPLEVWLAGGHRSVTILSAADLPDPLPGADPETIDTGTIPSRYEAILENKALLLNGSHRIDYDMDKDMLWRYDLVLKTHPNGMRFSCFDRNGDMLATNEYFSVGGGFVVNEKTKVDENLFYKGVDKKMVHGARLHQSHSIADSDSADPSVDKELNQDHSHPPYPFDTGNTLLALTKKHNMTIAQIVHDNEKFFGYSDEDIHHKLMRIWQVMDECIHTGVSSQETTLPGRLGVRRRAPMLYRRLMRGFYPGIATPAFTSIGAGMPSASIESPLSERTESTPGSPGAKATTGGPLLASSKPPLVIGSFNHAILPMPPRKTVIPAMDFLSCYAIAVNEVNAAGGRIVTSPTNGAAGVIPGVLKYILEFVSDDPEKSIKTFLLTASAVGMLFKRGSTISAAEGGCQAEVGVACSMASAGFAACMGASPETVLQAAEIGIEHNLGLTCDPIDGLVQVPCIERNSLGAVKAVTAAQLSMASHGVYSVTLDEAIEAMKVTAADMSVKYKETSLSGLATSVKIPLTVPAC
ncbi:hypothetical protein EST38_g1890 [Candolleomyces aberdarensis]|uniref:L-serine ammonia-lyase n=1 Tax=Candolleomyces aberdarensis TaxID=2316362 RepID=A0A4Q2DUQ3_9AGAR|nr:hypothetical protein EST38_g1890 [Candolleomyces aberdarensis]